MFKSYTVYTTPPRDFAPICRVAGCYCSYDSKILMVKRSSGTHQGGTWGVPGGKSEKNETPKETVIREIREEVGLDIDEPHLNFFGTLFIRTEVEYVFHMFNFSFREKPKVILALNEHSEAAWLKLDEAYRLPLIKGGAEALNFYKNNVKV